MAAERITIIIYVGQDLQCWSQAFEGPLNLIINMQVHSRETLCSLSSYTGIMLRILFKTTVDRLYSIITASNSS